MSKIIIDNLSDQPDTEAVKLVLNIMEKGLISKGQFGDQYCRCTTSHKERIVTFCEKRKSGTNRFEVRNDSYDPS